MDEKLEIAILGAGGVGSLYGAALARAGHTVTLLARGANLEALRSRGLVVQTPEESFTVAVGATGDADGLGAPDFAIVAVKTYDLPAVVPAARRVAERGAVVLPLLNGVDAARRLVEGGVPAASILGGLTHVSAARVAPGVVARRSPFQRVTVGELAGGPSFRAERIADAFRGAGIEASVSPDIEAELWKKLAFIASMAAACGLARAPIGAVRDTPWGMLLFERAVGEVFAVASARGVHVAPDEPAKTLGFVASLGPGMKPSFLLDLEGGGPTELDDLCGAVGRLGREAGVETPIHDTATAALGAGRARVP